MPASYATPVVSSPAGTLGEMRAAKAQCPAGTIAIGGAYQLYVGSQSMASAWLRVQWAAPSDDLTGYIVMAHHVATTVPWRFDVQAICVNGLKRP